MRCFETLHKPLNKTFSNLNSHYQDMIAYPIHTSKCQGKSKQFICYARSQHGAMILQQQALKQIGYDVVSQQIPMSLTTWKNSSDQSYGTCGPTCLQFHTQFLPAMGSHELATTVWYSEIIRKLLALVSSYLVVYNLSLNVARDNIEKN